MAHLGLGISSLVSSMLERLAGRPSNVQSIRTAARRPQREKLLDSSGRPLEKISMFRQLCLAKAPKRA